VNRLLVSATALLLGAIPAQLACAAPPADVSASRRNAIVRAAEQVSPAVVSVIVTQVQVVTYDPFGGFGIDDFFRDFFPRRQYRQEVKSMGSGVIASSEGDVITNAHVVLNATEVKVTLPDGRELDAEVRGIDTGRDLALLRVEAERLPVAPLGGSGDLMIGEWTIAFGNPFGFLLEDAQPTVTVGVVSALHRDIKSTSTGDYTDMIQTDAAINPGNSGGPLCNADGEVIGINTFIFTHAGGSEGIGFARPIDEVKEFMAEVKGAGAAGGSATRYKTGIGAVVSDIDAGLRSRYGLAHRNGVVIVEVADPGIAREMGLAPGDVVLMAQGKVIRSAAGLQRLYEEPVPVVDIVIDRAGEQSRLLYHVQ